MVEYTEKYYLLHCPLCDFSRWLSREQHRRWGHQTDHRCPRCEMGYWTLVGEKKGLST